MVSEGPARGEWRQDVEGPLDFAAKPDADKWRW